MVSKKERPLSLSIDLAERGLLPDLLIRAGIRRLDRLRLASEAEGGTEGMRRKRERFLELLQRSPIAPRPQKPREQHYEIPPAFFQLALGRRLKYSGCYWPEGVETLDAAEEAMLELYCQRAGMEDGMDVLDLGCGWGSLTLWLAERFPRSRVLAVSNARNQIDHIQGTAAERGFANVETMVCDMNEMKTGRRFDRVFSIEMFEHMRNWKDLLRNISEWLKPDGKLFLHIFTHSTFAYLFEEEGSDDWMGRYFFSAGMMPSDDLIFHFQDDLRVEEHWALKGTHYMRTAEAWLSNLDRNRGQALETFADLYGRPDARRWLQRWRMFFMACAELWGYAGGEEWLVSHYRLGRR